MLFAAECNGYAVFFVRKASVAERRNGCHCRLELSMTVRTEHASDILNHQYVWLLRLHSFQECVYGLLDIMVARCAEGLQRWRRQHAMPFVHGSTSKDCVQTIPNSN